MATTDPSHEDRYLVADPNQRRLARELYDSVRGMPLVCPHGHVNPQLFANADTSFGTPTQLLIIPDHYVIRMLYSQGLRLEPLGVARVDGTAVESDHRRIWQVFADHFYLFRGTPTGIWLSNILSQVFGVEEKLTGATAGDIYDQVSGKLASPAFRPRALFERFNIEVLCTTDAATDPLDHHRAIRASGWRGDIRPTFRPDNVTDMGNPSWRQSIDALSDVTGISVDSYSRYIGALEERRIFFKSMGAVATDHGAETAYTEELSVSEANALFQRGLRGLATPEDHQRFIGHMMMEYARMSVEDGLVMQFHVGSARNHNETVFQRFGPDAGCDIPVPCEFTRNLGPLLNKYGNDSRLALIVFTLDESTYSRELAPLAGHYPGLKLGPPWWFHDSPNGMMRYLEQVTETAGLYNTVGFNDDTRTFPSIPVRHDLWRRMAGNWVSGLAVRGVVDMDDAREMMLDLGYRLARRAYKFDQTFEGRRDE
jgi:glucuronate isomerase